MATPKNFALDLVRIAQFLQLFAWRNDKSTTQMMYEISRLCLVLKAKSYDAIPALDSDDAEIKKRKTLAVAYLLRDTEKMIELAGDIDEVSIRRKVYPVRSSAYTETEGVEYRKALQEAVIGLYGDVDKIAKTLRNRETFESVYWHQKNPEKY